MEKADEEQKRKKKRKNKPRRKKEKRGRGRDGNNVIDTCDVRMSQVKEYK